MKKTLLSIIAIAIAHSSFAQWTTGTNINNTNTGNVGIGLNTPATLLTIGNDYGNGTTDIQRYLGLVNGSSVSPANGNGVGISFAVGNNLNPAQKLGVIDVVNEYYNVNSSMRFSTVTASGLTEKMRIDGSGNVGIGTTSPGSALTIKSASTGVSIEPGSGNYFGTLAFNRESRTGAIFNSSGNAFQINNGGNDQNLHIQVYHGDGSLLTNNALVIDGTNGNIGIGTSDDSNWQLANSTYKLAVSGSVIATAVTVKLRSTWPDYVSNQHTN